MGAAAVARGRFGATAAQEQEQEGTMGSSADANDGAPVAAAAGVEIEPFTVRLPQATLDDLRDRLGRARWPDAFADAGWDLGTDPDYLRELAAYWRDGFDWRRTEAALNAAPQFRATVAGVGVHFAHLRGRGPAPLPLILTHGWPSSFMEPLALARLLSDPAAHGGDPADAFDVVVPSVPGFGFSDRPTARGTGEARIADLWARLMTDGLGYPRFATHGGDVGSMVSRALGRQHPERLIGVHVIQDADWGPAEGAYAFLQATKPQTVAFGLNDSPVGLAGWIVEKFRAWSDCGGDVERRFGKDDLLATATLYWATETIGSSIRLYAEGGWGAPEEPVTVPAGVALVGWSGGPAPTEADAAPFADLRRVTRMERGGHFLAAEEPALLADDLRAFFRPLRDAA
jgi:pimeloyl-ACP methyl ester carboxylesterase